MKVLLQLVEELFLRQAIEILDYAVVVDDRQLVIREAHSHEVVVFFVPRVVGVLLTLLITYEGSSRRAVVSVSDVESGHFCEELRDALDVGSIIDDPELVTEAIERSDEAVDGLLLGVLSDDSY